MYDPTPKPLSLSLSLSFKKNPGSREFTEIKHISLYYVYKNAPPPPPQVTVRVVSIMPPCTWISYLPCEY